MAGDDLAAAIKKIAITNLVTVVWTLTDKQKCVASIEAIIDPAKEGTVTGLLVAKGANFIDVKPLDKDGKPDAKASTERYMPKWHDGAMDKDVTAAIAAAKVGATVQVTWTRDERKRVTALTVTAEPKDEGKK